MESVAKNHPFNRLKSKPKKWLQGAAAKMKAKGTEGSLTRIAQSHGESAMTYAHEHYHDSGAIGKKSRFAVNAQK